MAPERFRMRRVKAVESHGSRLALIRAAGELFAERGFEAVSTRDIADKAGVNLGLIHYHFGSKQHLHTAALRHAAARGSQERLREVNRATPEQMSDPKKLSEIIYRTIEAWFDELLHPGDEPWRARLILREFADPSPAFRALVGEIFHADVEALVSLYRCARPHGSDDEARAWAFMPAAHALLLHQARQALLVLLGRRELSDDFIDSVIRTLALAMILLAGLPLPKELQYTRDEGHISRGRGQATRSRA